MDFIADCLTILRNAVLAKHSGVVMPTSRIVSRILEVFLDNGFIESVSKTCEGSMNMVDVKFKKKNPIHSIQRISKLGRRVYVGYKGFPRVLNNMGLVVVSTSKGIMSTDEARKKRIGGELLCSIY